MVKNRLTAFLEVLGIYELFRNNLVQHQVFLARFHGMQKYDLKKIIKINENNPWIISTFAWAETPEGLLFWKEISDLWKRIC